MNKERVYLWDNLKFILIFFVVLGHFVEQYMESNFFKSIFIFIYAFHMPLFIFVSGLFHKNKDIASKIVMYVLIGFLYKAAIYFVQIWYGVRPSFNMFSGVGVPWYMFALAVFIGITYLLRNVNKKLLLLCSIVISLLAGYDTNIGDYLYLSRLFVFYPFYLLGTMADGGETIAEFVKRKEIKIFGIAILLIWGILCVYSRNSIYWLRPFFTGRNPYSEQFYCSGGAVRLLQYVITCTVAFGVMCLTPQKKLPVITICGSRTMQVYFWHRILLYVLIGKKIVTPLFATREGKILYIFLALVITLLLSCEIFSFPTGSIQKLSKGTRNE